MLPVQGQAETIYNVSRVLNQYEFKLNEINQKIWSNPELAFTEHNAHDNICELFESLGAGY
ncbi:hypothetical protein PDIG_68380 [Penicillium digitatum PHI26]|uniref:Uncharacterized protein n=2 Tax=Penicillium digitatum TaxID=36651 RepID=K9G0L9_PEND2|nr:hypothetical protein PDIP_77670 [Penicillium digitatum Pd1]EKV06731.1 hypothetical protein PDIP_77670 [Penicillium digitatum Pd1]EKV08433.1 hypothetical protein PDIG_68380 [Penicillium digitatum PHI26]